MRFIARAIETNLRVVARIIFQVSSNDSGAGNHTIRLSGRSAGHTARRNLSPSLRYLAESRQHTICVVAQRISTAYA
jgi:hypothetical protein